RAYLAARPEPPRRSRRRSRGSACERSSRPRLSPLSTRVVCQLPVTPPAGPRAAPSGPRAHCLPQPWLTAERSATTPKSGKRRDSRTALRSARALRGTQGAPLVVMRRRTGSLGGRGQGPTVVGRPVGSRATDGPRLLKLVSPGHSASDSATLTNRVLAKPYLAVYAPLLGHSAQM